MQLGFGMLRHVLVALLVALAATATTSGAAVQSLTTAGGVPFAILGDKPARPAPTLFILARSQEETLGTPDYLVCGKQLADQGYLCVSIDVPCHGRNRRDGEPDQLAGWAHRVNAGEELMTDFCGQARDVLDHLIADGYTNPKKIAVAGTSRGGFAALHLAAADPRVSCVAAFMPVTDLAALSEFQSVNDRARVEASSVGPLVGKFANRGVWIVIGDQDTRVGTAAAVKFANALVAAAKDKKARSKIQMHVVPEPRGHALPAGAPVEAARWILEQHSSP